MGLGVVSGEGEVGESKVALRSDEYNVELAGGVDSCTIAEAVKPRQSVTWLPSIMHGLSTTFPRGSVVTKEGIGYSSGLFHTVWCCNMSSTLYKLERVINNRAM